MAAGAGSRFGGPKQTTPVGPHGEWLLEYALYDAKRAGFDRAVCIIREELADDFARLAARVAGTTPVTSVVQRTTDVPHGIKTVARDKPWGIGEGVERPQVHRKARHGRLGNAGSRHCSVSTSVAPGTLAIPCQSGGS